MFLFNFISGLDNYPIPLVFRPQHTHNYKSLRDAVFETNVKTANKSMMSAIFRIPPPPKKMVWGGRGDGQIISGRLCAISFTIHHCNNNKKIIIIV